jgi:WD40 repeat protein/DNA-binding Xre family transcriptional regulator
MSRSLQVRHHALEQVKVALRRQGFGSQKALSQDLGLSLSTVSRFLTGKAVDFDNFIEICDRLDLDWQALNLLQESNSSERSDLTNGTISPHFTPRQDWGEMVDISGFLGRKQELQTLSEWILRDRCRLITLMGMGGIGKTALAAMITQRLHEAFEVIIWRSVRNAPSAETLVSEWLEVISDSDSKISSLTWNEQLLQLRTVLQVTRCLLVVDNFETILQCNSLSGRCREEHRNYVQLLTDIAGTHHNSCLILTSREQLAELVILEGPTLPVRSLSLGGLTLEQAQAIVQTKGDLQGTKAEWKALIDWYAGNPLALKIASVGIRDLFGANLSRFLSYLQHESFRFEGTRSLLQQQFDRLSEQEQDVLYWLAIEREPIELETLRQNLLCPAFRKNLPEVVQSLLHRSLIERTLSGFTLQPEIMAYVTDQFVHQTVAELIAGELFHFNQFFLLNTDSPDFVQSTQEQSLLDQIVLELLAVFPLPSLVSHLKSLLSQLQQNPAPGYAAGNLVNLLRQVQADLSEWDFSHLTLWQADLRGVRLHGTNFTAASIARSTFSEALGIPQGLAFSSSGQQMGISDTSGVVHLFAAMASEKSAILQGHKGWIWSLAFSDDEKQVVSASGDQNVKLWNLVTGECCYTLEGHRYPIWTVTFSKDNQTIISVDSSLLVRHWSRATGQSEHILQLEHPDLRSLAVCARQNLVASSSRDGSIKLWDLWTGQCLQSLQVFRSWGRSIAFSPTDTLLASGGEDTTIILWDLKTNQYLQTLKGHVSRVSALSFSTDGQILASGSDDGVVKLWRVQTGQFLKTLVGHSSWIWSVNFSPSEPILATGSGDRSVKLWDYNTGACLRTLQGQSYWSQTTAFSPCGQIIACGNEDKAVYLWDVNAGQWSHTLLGHTARIYSVAFSPNRQILASGSGDCTIKLWHTQTGRCQQTLQGHSSWVGSIAFSPRGDLLASGSEDQTIKLWDINQGTCVRTLHEHQTRISSLAFSPDGCLLASGGYDQTIKLWALDSGDCVQTLIGHSGWVWSVVFSPDGQTLASGSGDRSIKLWNLSTGRCESTLSGHEDQVWSVAISPNGKLLASASSDQTIKIWNLETGELHQTLIGHNGLVWSVVFSPDGQRLVSSSQDETIKFWHLDTGKCWETIKFRKLYEAMNITDVTGLTTAQKMSLKALGAREF